MDESELSASRRANYLTRQLGDTGGSFDVLISYDSEIQRQESAGDRTNRSQETLRELAGLSRIESPSSRQDYEEVSLPRGEILDDDISEIPVRDVDSVSTVVPDAGLVTTTGHLQTQPQFDLFSAASLPSSPDRLPSHEGPQILNSSDPLVEGDRNTARYLRILVPQQDTGSRALTPPLDIPQPQPGYSRNTSYNISDGELFESLPSTSEFLLLESPSDSPAHFSQLRLTLNSIESDGETFLSLDESVGEQQQHSLNNSFLRQPSRQHSRSKQKVTNKSKAIEDTQVVGSDLKKELQRLVVEIYSERNTEFVPIPGLISNRMDAIHSARNTTQQADLKSRTMGDGHPSFVHFQDNMSSVEDIMDAKTVSTAPDSQTTCNFDGADKAAVSGSDRPQPAGASLETLSALSSTADALALQRSVIGSSPTKPASMEEIAAAIAAAEKQYRQRLQYYKQQQQPEQQHNGNPPFNMNTLDEMPTRLPATPPRDTSEDNTLVQSNHEVNYLASNGNQNITHTYDPQQGAPARTKSLPNTTRVRPGSLVAQNTGLAVSSAVGARFGTPTSSKEHSLSPKDSSNKDPVFFRSPVQAITTSRGGRTIAVHKPDPKKVESKGSKKHNPKRVDNQVYSTPAEMKALIASHSEDLLQDKKHSKLPPSVVSVKAAEDQFQVQEVGVEPNSGVIVTSDPIHRVHEDPFTEHQAAHTSPLPSPEGDKPKQSFLGSFLQWGKKQEPQSLNYETSSSTAPSPGAASPGEFSSLGNSGKSHYSGLAQQTAAESHDSGIDLVPSANNIGEVFHADFEPVSASTPVKYREDSNGVTEPHMANNRMMSSLAKKADSDDETDSRLHTTRQGPLGESSSHQQTFPSGSSAQKSRSIRANHVGNSTSHGSMRRRDLNKLPSTRLTSVYGSLKVASPSFPATSTDPGDMESVLREKANLEGRLETLAVETEAALQQRAEMQTRVASLQAQLKAQSSVADTSQHQVSAIANDLITAQQNQAQLEQAVAALQNSLESKEEDLDNLHRDLESSESTSHRLNLKMEEIKEVMGAKEATIATLKEKIITLHKEAEKAHKERTQYLAELKTLQGDVESLISSKEWFEEQLQAAQESRSKLQKELTETQTQAKKQGAAVETLKADKAQLQHQLSETQQQALKEKELIAKHLETIEADFLAREAAFEDLQKEKTAVQEAVASRMDQMNEERSKLSNLIASCVELERQLDRTQKELADKKASVTNLEAEKKELIKRLALVQESLISRDNELEAMQEKCIDKETKLQELQSNSTEQEGALQNHRAEKASLEAALSAANQEKRAFDEALQTLRKDMGKVEQNFMQMKQELSNKNAQMEMLERDREDAQMQLHNAGEQLKHHQQSMESYQEDLSGKDSLVGELGRVKDVLESQIATLRQKLDALQKANKESHAIRAGLQDELAQSQEDFKDLEVQLESAMSENAHLEGQLEMMADEQQRFSNLLDENANLKQRLAETQSTTHRELADQRAKVLRLGSDLASTQKELKDKQRSYETTAGTLTRKLKEAMDSKQAAEGDLEALRQNAAASSIEVQNQLIAQLEAAKTELYTAQRDRDDLERQLETLKTRMEEEADEYKDRVAELEDQLQVLKDLCEQQQKNDEATRRMALDLERERGRLAGVQQSHSALKQHANLLEAALGRRETTLAEMAGQMSTSSQEHAAEEGKLRAKLREVTEALKKEKEASKKLQKQVASGKAETGRLVRDIQDQGEVLEETRQQQDAQGQELQALSQQLNKAAQLEGDQKMKADEVRVQLQEARGQIGQLKRQLQQKQSRDPVVAEQIKALEWESEQRGREAEALKEQLELAEHRQKIEMDNAQATVKMGRKELESLKAELDSTRKEKFAYQGKLSQFKSALKATLQQNKLLKAKLKSRQKERNAAANTKTAAGLVASGDVTMVPDDIIVPEISVDVEALLNSDDRDGITASSSKPLTALRGCLQSVKDQMGGLQQQMDEHTSAVNSSSRAWKDVESKVRDLRKSCMPPVEGSSSTAPTSTSRRSPPTTPKKAPPKSATPTANYINNSPRTTPASMTFPTLPNVYDI
ncbi:golgin subfamily A member 3-like isoform X1 [Asterias rubens]|uniref:golgin subfamily A member 3-like isoform X1 n=1 Tax=Asterias rubens TaxID=7604 RepID=UPI0014550B72|nr:golgin subfamily A member 3-like isoform X1 [Asterias rubens]